MLVAGFPAGAFATNCFVVAPAAGEECVVIDPGQDAAGGVAELLAEHRLKPVAVLLTHGHIDHVWSVVPVCGAHDIPAYLHPADRGMLSDPALGLSPEGHALVRGLTFTEPSDVRELTGDDLIALAGVQFRVRHAPGHTRGSLTFELPDLALFAGDLLFRGSVGRTDLPGGSYPELLESLARVVLPLPDEMPVLPGHGPATTIGEERAANPFLAEAASGLAPPRRGM